jgi:hypothetical protein
VSRARIASGLFGIVTFLPLLYVAFRAFEPLWLPPGGGPEYSLLRPLSASDVAALLLGVVLFGVCALLVYRSPYLDREKQRAWLMFLLFGSIFAFPILWYLLVFRERPAHEVHGNL